jgi:TatD DNase family protein
MTAALRAYDTHCHLGLDDSPAAPEHARARAAGVAAMLVVGIDLASSQRARELATTLPGVGWSAGLHPNAATQFAAEWHDLEALVRSPGCRAIGETGLDHYRDRCPPAQQELALRAHLELARATGLPVVLHCRDAFAPLYAVLQDHAPLRGVMHCFTGGVDEARTALDLGLLLSFAGPLTYPRNHALREAATFAPAAAVLVETDAPFLPPQRHRGQRNEVAYVLHTLAQLAELRGWSLEQAAATTFANAVALFGDPS